MMTVSDRPITPAPSLRSVVGKVEQLPPLPGAVERINELIADPDVSLDEVVRVISIDQSLTARILRLVNSAYYGLQRQVSTIRHALIILGLDEIRQIVLSTTVIRLFGPQKSHGGFDLLKFWEHSLGCAFAAKSIARSFHYRVTGEIFVAGLLHDIGKIIMSQYFPQEFGQIEPLVVKRGLSPWAAEKEAIGMTHGELGHLVADHWNLPYPIAEAIHHHHAPAQSTQTSLTTALIHLADVLSIQNGLDTGIPWKTEPTIDRDAWRALKERKLDLNETDLDRFSYELEKCQEQIHEFL